MCKILAPTHPSSYTWQCEMGNLYSQRYSYNNQFQLCLGFLLNFVENRITFQTRLRIRQHALTSKDLCFNPAMYHLPVLCLGANYITSLSLLFLIALLYGCILEKAVAPHSSTLAWKIPRMEEPGRLQSMGSRRVGHD